MGNYIYLTCPGWDGLGFGFLDTGENILCTVSDRGFHTQQKLLKDDFYHRSSGQKWGFNRLTDCGQLPSQVLAVENNDSIVFSKLYFHSTDSDITDCLYCPTFSKQLSAKNNNSQQSTATS